jgi:hypothetical protein
MFDLFTDFELAGAVEISLSANGNGAFGIDNNAKQMVDLAAAPGDGANIALVDEMFLVGLDQAAAANPVMRLAGV